jgi:hypothetical protein
MSILSGQTIYGENSLKILTAKIYRESGNHEKKFSNIDFSTAC